MSLFMPNILTLFAAPGLVEPPNGVTWTISTMAFFYLCYPCLIPRLRGLCSAGELQQLLRKMYCLQLAISLGLFVIAAALPLGEGASNDASTQHNITQQQKFMQLGTR